MGRALDNAMLNVGMKDVARCKSRPSALPAISTDMLQPAWPILASELKMSSPKSMTPPLVTEVLVVSQLASWTAWLPLTTQHGATVFDTDMASSSKKLWMGIRLRFRTIGSTSTHGSFQDTTSRSTSSSTETSGDIRESDRMMSYWGLLY